MKIIQFSSIYILKIIKEVQPDEIYNLGAQSHVGVSFEVPEYTANVDAIGTLRILDSIKTLGLDISSSVIGWSCLLDDGSKIALERYGHIKPPPSKSGSLAFRMNSAFDSVSELFRDVRPDVVSIESYANKFSKGTVPKM